MTISTQPRTWVRVTHGLAALAFASFVLFNYWPLVKLLDLSRADLGYQGVWLEGYAKQITAVTPGGAAERAGLKPGDVLEFDPGRSEHWVLASYRNMPEGFAGSLPVRHADGTRTVAAFVPERVPYLPTLSDRLALVVRLCGLTVSMLIGLLLVWARPSWMSWSVLLMFPSAAPVRIWSTGFLAFTASESTLDPIAVAIGALMYLVIFNLAFSLSFPRDLLPGWTWWKRMLGLAVLLGLAVWASPGLYVRPFAQDAFPPQSFMTWIAIATVLTFAAVLVLARTYFRAGSADKARLKWAVLGLSSSFAGVALVGLFLIFPFNLANPLSGSGLTSASWIIGLIAIVVFPLSFGYAVLRQRVVDLQFAVGRTLVYGIVSAIVLLFLTLLDWLLGRLIEHSGLTFGLEGLAAVGLGLVLHRASQWINTTVDRLLFRKHHAAEERLRRVTAALPFATGERSITEALVLEPVRNLELASAALFYRESAEGPLTRVLAHGWSDAHATSLAADDFLVRYLQAEHAALTLDDEHTLPPGMPQEDALPVLAVPIVNQHVLHAVVLYGPHTNGTLPDPDEVVLLSKLAEAAALAYQQLRIATLARQNDTQRTRIIELEASLRALGQKHLLGGEQA